MAPRFLRGALLLGALALGPAPLQAQPPLREVVERFDAAQAKVATLQAPFSLTIRRSLLKTPTVTKGTLWLQESDFAHFTFAPPEDLVIHITPKALVSYSPGEGAAEMVKIGIIKNANRKFLGLGQKLSYLSDYFRISVADAKEPANTWLLVLEPRSTSVRKRIQLLQIWVDRDTWLPRQMNWVERSGDSWLLELGALALNGPIPASVSGFKVPPGTPTRDEFSFFATRRK
ncbi:MAG TPA: outer membrane lipoprotein carrier protein LolA [Holophaga sp.]|nr:outer membrane lipoprotein carrier protein LolA [Holophaga sp.]